MRRLLLLVLVVGCATAPIRQDIQKIFEFDAGYDDVWAAIIDTFGMMQLPIDNVEKDSGLITTDWLSFEVDDGYADCGKGGFGRAVRDLVGRFNVVARDANGTVSVTVNTLYEANRVDVLNPEISSEVRCYSTGVLEADLVELVEERIGE